MIVTVEQIHIDGSLPNDSSNHPICLAVKERVKELTGLDTYNISFSEFSRLGFIIDGNECVAFIIEPDILRMIEQNEVPIKFEIDVSG